MSGPHAGGWRRRSRDANHGPLVAALEACGRVVIDLDPLKDAYPGIPDILVFWPGGFCFLELKTATGKLRKAQIAWHAAYRGPKGTLGVARTQEEALRATGIDC